MGTVGITTPSNTRRTIASCTSSCALANSPSTASSAGSDTEKAWTDLTSSIAVPGILTPRTLEQFHLSLPAFNTAISRQLRFSVLRNGSIPLLSLIAVSEHFLSPHINFTLNPSPYVIMQHNLILVVPHFLQSQPGPRD